jgi:hypothetical protein
MQGVRASYTRVFNWKYFMIIIFHLVEQSIKYSQGDVGRNQKSNDMGITCTFRIMTSSLSSYLQNNFVSSVFSVSDCSEAINTLFSTSKEINVYSHGGKQIVQNTYRVIHKSLRNFRTRQPNNQDKHNRKEHISR